MPPLGRSSFRQLAFEGRLLPMSWQPFQPLQCFSDQALGAVRTCREGSSLPTRKPRPDEQEAVCHLASGAVMSQIRQPTVKITDTITPQTAQAFRLNVDFSQLVMVPMLSIGRE